jgi:hypothetical protein
MSFYDAVSKGWANCFCWKKLKKLTGMTQQFDEDDFPLVTVLFAAVSTAASAGF